MAMARVKTQVYLRPGSTAISRGTRAVLIRDLADG